MQACQQLHGCAKVVSALCLWEGTWFVSALWFKRKSREKQINELLFCRQTGITQSPQVCRGLASQVSLPFFEGRLFAVQACPSATACRSDISTGNHPVAKAHFRAKPVGLYPQFPRIIILVLWEMIENRAC